jgi:hypothetical protein
MTTNSTDTSNRTERLLALMQKGDDAFNRRDFETVDTFHHPDMVAHITGLPAPVYGSKAHSEAMARWWPRSPTCTCTATPTRSSSEVKTGSQ